MTSPPPPRLSLKGSDEGGHQESVAVFVSKLWNMLGKPEYKHLISWSKDGDTFIVKDSNKFGKEVLPYYFKHNNFNSFVRQLNLYGFRKMARPDYGSLPKTQANGDDALEFWHSQFHRDSPNSLHLVHRRQPSKHHEPKGQVAHKEDSVDKNPHRLSAVISDIHQMKGRQEGIATVLETLKQDNSHLRHEIGVLKDKHIRQQKILNKIIHFLVHMVYSKGKIPATMRSQRSGGTSRLMLMDSDILGPQGKRMRMEETSPIEELPNLDSPTLEFSGLPTLSPTILNTAASMFVPPSSTSLVPASVLPVSSPITVLSPPSEQSVTSPPIQSVTSPPVVSTPSSPYPPSVDTPTASTSDFDSVTVLSSSTSPFKSTAVTTTSEGLTFDPVTTSTTVTAAIPTTGPTTLTSDAFVATSSASSPYLSLPLQPYPPIPDDILLPPAPSSLVPVPHPENRMCIHGQLEHQQMGLDSLPEFLSNHLSLDPSMLTDFVMSEHLDQLPDYDMGDTARLLDSLANSDNPLPEGMVNLQALVPVQGGGGSVDTAPYFLPDVGTQQEQEPQVTEPSQ